MDISVILLIVEENLVIEDNLVALDTILVARLYLESYTTGDWKVGQLKFLTRLILFSSLLGELQELAAHLMLQLHFNAIYEVLTTLVDELNLVLCLLIIFALLKNLETLKELLILNLIVFDLRGVARQL